MAEDNNILAASSRNVKKSKVSCNDRGMFSKQNEKVASCMFLIITHFSFLYLLGPCFRNLVFRDLGGKLKHFRPKVAKDGLPNSRKFFAFGTSKEPKSKNVSKNLKIGNRFSDIAFLFLA